MRVVLGLAAAGIRQRPLPWLLLSLGVALAVAFPVFGAGLRQEAGAAAVSDTLAALPAYERTVLVNTYRNVRGESVAQLDQTVRRGLDQAGAQDVAGALVFRPISIASTNVGLAALDQFDRRVRVTSGRVPRRCDPQRCEVVSVALPGVRTAFTGAERAERELGIVVTGTAELVDQRLAGVGIISPGRPLLLGGSPAGIAELESLQLFGRSLAWFATLDGAAIAGTGVESYGRRLTALADAVNLAGDGPLSVTWPAEELAAAEARAASSADRFAVLGAGSGALQLGLCLVVAAWLRRRQQLVGMLLVRRGAGSGQVTAVTVIQALAIVAFGLVIGVAVAAIAVAIRAGPVGAAPVAAATSAVLGAGRALLALALAAVLAVVAVVRWPAAGGGAARWVAVSTLAVAVLMPFVVLTGGASVAGRLATVAIIAAVVAVGLGTALAWPLVVGRRGGGPPRRLTRRLTTASSVTVVARRRPLLPMVTAGFLAASCCLLVFTTGYRESLQQSGADQAAYRVPLDVAVTPSARVAAPLDALDPDRVRQVSPGAVVRPIVTAPVTAFGGTPGALALPLTGLDPVTLTEIHQFDAVTGSSGPAELAQRLAVQRPDRPTPSIAAGARRITFDAAGLDADVTVGLWLGTADGEQQLVRLSRSGTRLVGVLPVSGSTAGIHGVQGIELSESDIRVTRREHAAGEGKVDHQVTAGQLVLGRPEIDNQPIEWTWSGWGSGQAGVRGDADQVAISYRFGDARVVITPDFVAPRDRGPIPVAVDPDTAARADRNGRLVLSSNKQSLQVQVVAVLPRFPGAGAHFVLADRAAVVSLLNEIAPGTAYVSRIWIGVPEPDLPAVRAALEASPAAAATLTFRADLASAITDDPVAVRSILLLLVGGAVALGLGMVAAGTAVRADLEESQVDALALELDGVPPAGLRRRLLRRSLLVAAVAVPAGLLGGGLLTLLGVRLLLTGPAGAAVVPPLRAVLGGLPIATVVAAAVVGLLAAALAAVATTFRDEWPPVTDLDLP